MRSKIIIAACFLAAAILMALFSRSPERVISASELACTGCNVVIIGFDALQANHVSHLGYFRKTTPTVDALAERGVSFSRSFAVASWTVPSFMSYFTSVYPAEHKVVNKFVTFTPEEQVIANLNELSPHTRTLAQAFKDAGYATGGFTGDAGVHSQFGYDKGFEIYTDETAFGSVENSAEKALSWLDERGEEPFFLWVHGYDAHGQSSAVDEHYESRFGGTEGFDITPERQRDLREEGLAKGELFMEPAEVEAWNSWYDSKIRDADERIGAFLEGLGERGLLDSTVIVVISDHGTEVYDHRRFDHGYSLYNEIIRVPFVIAVPGAAIGETIPTTVRSIDLAPTLFDIVGLDPGEAWRGQMQGESLVPVITGESKEHRPVYSATDYRNYTHKRSLIAEDGWKLIYTLESGEAELYDLNADFGEKKDLAHFHPERVAAMTERLFGHMRMTGEEPEQDWPIGCLPVYGDQCLDQK